MADPQDTIRMLFDHVAAKDLAGASERFAMDAVFTDAAGPTVLEGRSAIREMLDEMWRAFPDLQVEVRAMVADRPTVMAEIELVGSHLGPFLGCPPSGRIIRWPGVAHYEVNDEDQIVSESFFYDSASLMAQLLPEGA